MFQYDAASAGNVVDEVKYAYDGWSNVATIEQDVNSAVGAMGSVDDYDVSFSYEKATNGRNTIRRTGVTLPSGDAVGYAYSNAHALHDEEASRVSQVTFTVGVGTTVATYLYNGQGEEQHVYHAAGLDGRGGSSYIDDVILRDFDDTSGWDSASDGMFETRQYYCQNWRHDVVAVINERGGQVEQVRYSSYGVPFGLPAGDADSDGDVESSDLSQINTWAGGTYDVRGDLDLDGDVDGTDYTIASGHYGNRLGRQALSLVNSRLGYAGYRWMSELAGAYAFYHVRHRVLNSSLGVWMTRDPMGNVDGPSLYGYVGGNPAIRWDPSGLLSLPDLIRNIGAGGQGGRRCCAPTPVPGLSVCMTVSCRAQLLHCECCGGGSGTALRTPSRPLSNGCVRPK